MSEIQHAGAKKILRIIERTGAHSGKLTYRTVAQLMGEKTYEKNPRPIAQMCDLLDAAACLAGVPLLALIAVRDRHGNVNPKAWANLDESSRNAIIARSDGYPFSRADYLAIGRWLSDLKGLGNRKAWSYVKRIEGGRLFRRFIGDESDSANSALDDLGSDHPIQVSYTGTKFPRDSKVRLAVLARAKGTCEYCGKEGFPMKGGKPYLETHHVIGLAKQGPDKVTNVIAVCANDHRKAHFSDDRIAIEKEMVQKLKILNTSHLPKQRRAEV